MVGPASGRRFCMQSGLRQNKGRNIGVSTEKVIAANHANHTIGIRQSNSMAESHASHPVTPVQSRNSRYATPAVALQKTYEVMYDRATVQTQAAVTTYCCLLCTTPLTIFAHLSSATTFDDTQNTLYCRIRVIDSALTKAVILTYLFSFRICISIVLVFIV